MPPCASAEPTRPPRRVSSAASVFTQVVVVTTMTKSFTNGACDGALDIVPARRAPKRDVQQPRATSVAVASVPNAQEPSSAARS